MSIKSKATGVLAIIKLTDFLTKVEKVLGSTALCLSTCEHEGNDIVGFRIFLKFLQLAFNPLNYCQNLKYI